MKVTVGLACTSPSPCGRGLGRGVRTCGCPGRYAPLPQPPPTRGGASQSCTHDRHCRYRARQRAGTARQGPADLTDRARVVWAAARSDAAVPAAAAKFGFPHHHRHRPGDHRSRGGCRAGADAGQRASADRRRPRSPPASTCCARSRWKSSLDRAEQLIAAGRRRRPQARHRAAGAVSPRQPAAEAGAGRGPLGEVQAASMTVPWWRPQAYYDQPGRGVKARDGGGVLITQAIHTLDLFRWLVGVASGRSGADPHDGSASHGNRGLRRGLGASRQRCAGHHHGDHRRLSRQPGVHHRHRHAGHRAAGGRQPAPGVARRARGGAGR